MDAVSKAASIDEQRLLEIEREGRASKKESRQLAAALGVPEYALGLSKLPVKPLPQDFRTKGNLTPIYGLRGLRAIYDMQNLADFSAMLGESLQVHPTFQRYAAEEFGTLSADNPKKVINALSTITNYRFNEAVEEMSAPELFNALRHSIEARRVLVICERLAKETYRGFCLGGAIFPIIYINTYKQPHRIRTFTLIHELVHLLVGRPGVVDPFNTRSGIERACNSITAQFLLPTDEFLKLAKRLRQKGPREWVNQLADRLPFSKFFIALRIQEVFAEKGFVNDWLATFPRKITIQGDDRDLTRYDLSDQDLVTIGEIEGDEDRDETGNVPRLQTAASYQVNRLGGALIALIGAALSSRLVSRYDIFDQVGVKATVIDKAVKSARQKQARARRFQ